MAVEVQQGIGTARAGDLPAAEAARPKPVVYLAVAGALMIAFQAYVLGRWVTGPHLKSTPPGPDTISSATQALYTAIQAGVSVATVICLYVWVVRPWRRDGRLTTDGMLAISGGMLFFWDMCMNYTSTSLLYNSKLVNLGAWANGSWPGWTSPGANRLPEPIFVTVPGYTCLVFAQVVVILALLRKVKARRPQLGFLGTIGVIVGGLFLLDTIIETCLLRTGLYAYPGAIRSVTLFAGHTYQMPLTESFFFGGLGLGALAALSHFRDDRGQTVAERGLERLHVSDSRRQLIKFLAIFGTVHVAFFALYMVPNQWLATHAGPFPQGYKSYMINGMCQAGADGKTCPGPGVLMPRPKGTF